MIIQRLGKSRIVVLLSLLLLFCPINSYITTTTTRTTTTRIVIPTSRSIVQPQHHHHRFHHHPNLYFFLRSRTTSQVVVRTTATKLGWFDNNTKNNNNNNNNSPSLSYHLRRPVTKCYGQSSSDSRTTSLTTETNTTTTIAATTTAILSDTTNDDRSGDTNNNTITQLASTTVTKQNDDRIVETNNIFVNGIDEEQSMQQQQSPPLLQQGEWEAYLDTEQTGLVYYYNTRTGVSQWERPTANFPRIPLTRSMLEIITKKYQDSKKQQQQQQQQIVSPISEIRTTTTTTSTESSRTRRIDDSELKSSNTNDDWIISMLDLQIPIIRTIDDDDNENSIVVEDDVKNQDGIVSELQVVVNAGDSTVVNTTGTIENNSTTASEEIPESVLTTTTTRIGRNPPSWFGSLLQDLPNKFQLDYNPSWLMSTSSLTSSNNNNNTTTVTILSDDNSTATTVEEEQEKELTIDQQQKLEYFNTILSVANAKVQEQIQINIERKRQQQQEIESATKKAAEAAVAAAATTSVASTTSTETTSGKDDGADNEQIEQQEPTVALTATSNDVIDNTWVSLLSIVENENGTVLDTINGSELAVVNGIEEQEPAKDSGALNSDEKSVTTATGEEQVIESPQTPPPPPAVKEILQIESATYILPHPLKMDWGGEDAVFINHRTFGVFDGVSGAEKEDGVPLYSRTLAYEMSNLIDMEQQERQKQQDTINRNKKNPYDWNNMNSYKKKQPIQRLIDQLLIAAEIADEIATGASTAIVGSITEDGLLNVVNVGDSTCIVIRNNTVLVVTDDISHYHECPYQLSIDSPDRPRDGTKLRDVQLQPNDIIVVASDGIFDNLFHNEISEIIQNGLANNNVSLQDIVTNIALRARTVSLMPVTKQNDGTVIGPTTPYSILAKQFNDPDFVDGLGGKVDDVCCILIRCS